MKSKISGLIIGLLLISVSAFAADGDLIVNGKVGVGTTNPVVKLDASGEIRPGNSGQSCNASIEGAMRYNATGKTIEFCNGTGWMAVNANQSSGGGGDSYTKLLLHMDGTTGSTTFTDSSASAHTVTAYGSAQIDSTQFKFGTASGYFNGTGSYLSAPDSDDWSFGSGDFTIDFWYRPVALNDLQVFVSQYVGGGNYWRAYRYNDWQDSNRLWIEFYAGGAYKGRYKTTNGGAFSINQWYHLAFVRNGATVKIFIDGVSQELTEVYAIGTNDVGNVASSLDVGQMAGEAVNGYLDEFRISKGIARWTSNFTPPTQPY